MPHNFYVFDQVSLLNATNGLGLAIPVNVGDQVTWEATWSAGVTAGVFQTEQSDNQNYAGKWALQDVVDFASSQGANSKQTGTFVATAAFVRGNITNPLSGGTLTLTFNVFVGEGKQ